MPSLTPAGMWCTCPWILRERERSGGNGERRRHRDYTSSKEHACKQSHVALERRLLRAAHCPIKNGDPGRRTQLKTDLGLRDASAHRRAKSKSEFSFLKSNLVAPQRGMTLESMCRVQDFGAGYVNPYRGSDAQ